MTFSSYFLSDGELQYSFEYPIRSITGIPFRLAVITSDEQHIAVSAADKTNRDCIMIYNATTGTFVNRISLKVCGIKVCFQSSINKNYYY